MATFDYTKAAFQTLLFARKLRVQQQESAALQRYRNEQLRIQQDMLTIRQATAERMARAETRAQVIDGLKRLNELAKIEERAKEQAELLRPLNPTERAMLEKATGQEIPAHVTSGDITEGPLGEVYGHLAIFNRQKAGPRNPTGQEIADRAVILQQDIAATKTQIKETEDTAFSKEMMGMKTLSITTLQGQLARKEQELFNLQKLSGYDPALLNTKSGEGDTLITPDIRPPMSVDSIRKRVGEKGFTVGGQ